MQLLYKESDYCKGVLVLCVYLPLYILYVVALFLAFIGYSILQCYTRKRENDIRATFIMVDRILGTSISPYKYKLHPQPHPQPIAFTGIQYTYSLRTHNRSRRRQRFPGSLMKGGIPRNSCLAQWRRREVDKENSCILIQSCH